MSSWNCDGNPKDGKIYPNFGGTHEPHENYSSDCEICGLPKKSQILPPSDNPLKTILSFFKSKSGLITMAIILLTGGSLYGFSTFTASDRYLKNYEKALENGEEGLSIVRTHSSPEELEQAQQYLALAITHLSKIPEGAFVYSDAKQKMNSYDNLSVQITNKLSNFKLCPIEPKPDSCIF